MQAETGWVKPVALLLAPGAGGDRNHHTLVAIEQAVGLPSHRMDFAYRKAGRKAPDRVPVAVASVREEAAQLLDRAGLAASSLVLGGRSYGGRMCSLAVAQGLPAAGLVLLSYPLHPPGKPEQLRSDHFPHIHVPCLFLGGLSDPFGTPAEFDQAVARLGGPVAQVWLKGGHEPARQDGVIARAVADWLASQFVVQ